MSEIQIVEIYGIKIEERCAVLLEIAIKFGNKGYSSEREAARVATKKLGEYGCTKALAYLVTYFCAKGYSSEREIGDLALKLI